MEGLSVDYQFQHIFITGGNELLIKLEKIGDKGCRSGGIILCG